MKKSIKKQCMVLTIASFMGLAIILSLVGYRTVFSSMTRQEESQMKSVVAQMRTMYDAEYPGQFNIRLLEDGSYIVYKGKLDMTKDYHILDEVKENFGYEVTLFCRNIRVQTTLTGEDGERLLDTKAAPKVDKEVLEGEKAKFYRNVKIEEEHCFAYYEPIILESGEVYGMIGVSRSAADVRRGVIRAVWPLALICFVLAIGLGFLSLRFTDGIVKAIEELQSFMNSVAKGDFQSDVPASLRKREDELGSLATDAKKMQRAIQTLVEYDSLTQLHNRRYGEKRLKQVIQSSEVQGTAFCVALAEMDHFKRVNDTYGLGAGDGALRAVSKIFKQRMNGHGFAARWGGEEFLLVFEMMDEDSAYEIMKQIREDLHACKILYDKKEIRVTMSMGLIRGESGETPEVLLRRADERLHEAKTGGRDQIRSDATSEEGQ